MLTSRDNRLGRAAAADLRRQPCSAAVPLRVVRFGIFSSSSHRGILNRWVIEAAHSLSLTRGGCSSEEVRSLQPVVLSVPLL